MARTDLAARRLATMPGISVMNATALIAAIGDGRTFSRGRDLSAWLGLVPRQSTTGGKPKLLGIAKRGSKYLCKANHPGRAGGAAVACQDCHAARRMVARPC
jgi:transposase